MIGRHRFKKTYLHIGLGKTGSTSIQSDLLAQASVLESQYDLHFPRSFPQMHGFNGNHSLPLGVLYQKHPDDRKGLAARGLDTQECIDAYNTSTEQALNRGFDNTSASQLLLSAEGIGRFHKADLIDLANWLRSVSEEVLVIACLRHPVAGLSSEIQQRLHIGGILEDLYENPPFYRYIGLFDRLEAAFNRDCIILYDFAQAIKNPGGLTTEFFSHMGFDTGALFQKQPAANTSMSHEAALLLSALNKRHPILVDGHLNSERSVGDSRAFASSFSGEKYSAPAWVCSKVEELADPHLYWLERHYGMKLAGDLPANRDNHTFGGESIEATRLKQADDTLVRNSLLSLRKAGRKGARILWDKLRAWF